MTNTSDIVAKLWSLCHVLRDDGITYHQYVTELTYLLFLKTHHQPKRIGPIRHTQPTTHDAIDQMLNCVPAQ